MFQSFDQTSTIRNMVFHRLSYDIIVIRLVDKSSCVPINHQYPEARSSQDFRLPAMRLGDFSQ
jgi:hypothetical protein